MYWQILLLGAAVAGALFVYIHSNNEQNAPHENHTNEKKKERKTSPRRHNISLSRPSKSGDKCFWCTLELSGGHWRVLSCQHALHKDCFVEFLSLDKKCLICQSCDPCVICYSDDNPLTEDNATVLSCQQHALHTSCFSKYKESGFTVCPLCRKDI